MHFCTVFSRWKILCVLINNSAITQRNLPSRLTVQNTSCTWKSAHAVLCYYICVFANKQSVRADVLASCVRALRDSQSKKTRRPAGSNLRPEYADWQLRAGQGNMSNMIKEIKGRWEKAEKGWETTGVSASHVSLIPANLVALVASIWTTGWWKHTSCSIWQHTRTHTCTQTCIYAHIADTSSHLKSSLIER